MTDILTDKVYRFVIKEGLIERGDTIIAGVSGGADSMCLFFILQEIAGRLDCSLSAVHVHHGIRGAGADRDEAFVRRICVCRGIRLRVFHGDVPAQAARDHLSLEEAGRRYRYACFAESAKDLPGAKIAVAHHLDDQCETVLMNLLRGAGPKGLAGIAAKRENIIRPLLCADRREIEAYLKRHDLDYCTDETNADTAYTRNRIRLELLPWLRGTINRAADRHLAETAFVMRDISDYLEGQAARAAAEVISDCEGGCRIKAAPFLQLDTAIQREVLRLALRQAGGVRDVGLIHIEQLRALFSAQAGSSLSLPGRRTAVREYESLRIGPAPSVPLKEGQEIPVRVPGTAAGIRFTLGSTPGEPAWTGQIPKNMYTKWFDYDMIKDSPVLRSRAEGDYMVIAQGKTKRVSRILIDEKIPREGRDRLLVLADGNHVLWIPVLGRISETVKVTAKTRRIMKAEILPGQESIEISGGRPS